MSAIKRLHKDLAELTASPVANVAAVPLDSNMLEWHCNIKQDDVIYHLILFFPGEYPYKSPSAEFVPVGLDYRGGATKPGKKGTQICLNIFSDFEQIHTEWAGQKGLGWSPGYTVQTVLMNVISFLATMDGTSQNLKLSRAFKCDDCSHTYRNPYPSLGGDGSSVDPGTQTEKDDNKAEKETARNIVDYMSKEKLVLSNIRSDNDLFGFGLAVSGPQGRGRLSTPCEFLTSASFYGMMKSTRVVHSVLKEDLKYFLPLYIHRDHGRHIRDQFERTMKDLSSRVYGDQMRGKPIEDIVMQTIPNLMCETVVQFCNGRQHTSDNSLNGYFSLHRLMLWALQTYPSLQGKIDSALQVFVENPTKRTKNNCPNIGQWLMFLSGTKKYSWQDVADAYLGECWKRNVMWYVKDDSKLADLSTPMEYRLKSTFTRTKVSRDLLAFQVSFLDIAMPNDMSLADIVRRYDENLGFPTTDMVLAMKSQCESIRTKVSTFKEWYSVVKLPAPTDNELFNSFVDAVKYANSTKGYFFTRR